MDIYIQRAYLTDFLNDYPLNNLVISLRFNFSLSFQTLDAKHGV